MTAHDPVNHPKHYTEHPSGVECIQITEHMGFCLGNAVKYIWRADLKGDAIEDLKKAVWYIQREVERREAAAMTAARAAAQNAAYQPYQPPNAPSVGAYLQQRDHFFNGLRDALRGDKQRARCAGRPCAAGRARDRAAAGGVKGRTMNLEDWWAAACCVIAALLLVAPLGADYAWWVA